MLWALPDIQPVRNAASYVLGGGYVVYAAVADQSPFSVGVGIAVTCIMAYMAFRQRADERYRETYLQLIGDLKQQMREDADASHANEIRMRETLHKTRDEANEKMSVLNLQREELSIQLSTANLQIATLTKEIQDLKAAQVPPL